MNTKKVGGSRAGKHREGNVRFSAYVTPRKKAIALITASMAAVSGMTITDLIWLGIETLAKCHGILNVDGEVRDEFKDMVTSAERRFAKAARERKVGK